MKMKEKSYGGYCTVCLKGRHQCVCEPNFTFAKDDGRDLTLIDALIESTRLLEDLKTKIKDSSDVHEIEQQIEMNKFSALKNKII